MILLTGDTHGEIDIHKLSTSNRRFLAFQRQMTADDYLIILGDFGLVWDGGPTDRWWLKWLSDKPFTTLFIDGNHENFDLLAQYPVKEWNGGLVQPIRHNILHLMRGQMFDLQGHSFFTLGGAMSHDRGWRIEGVSWWPQELPTEAELEEAWRTLEKHGFRADFILTHSLPTRLQQQLYPDDPYGANRLTDFLTAVCERTDFGAWFSGHYHMDGVLQQEPEVSLLYRAIRRVV